MKKLIDAWLTIWIHLISFLVGGAVCYTVTNWAHVSWQQISLAIFLVVFLLHIIEEGELPGGFYYMYNTVFDPQNQLYDRYPINRFSEMIENFLGIMLPLADFWFLANNTTVTACLSICIVEVPGHLVTGKKMKERLASKGKTNWYNPGLVTDLLGFLPVGIYLVVMLVLARASLAELGLGLLLGVASMLICIHLPDKVFMSKNSPFVYDHDYGYFNRFLT